MRSRSGAPGLAHEPPARQGWRLNHFIGGGHATLHQRREGITALLLLLRTREDKTATGGSLGTSPQGESPTDPTLPV